MRLSLPSLLHFNLPPASKWNRKIQWAEKRHLGLAFAKRMKKHGRFKLPDPAF